MKRLKEMKVNAAHLRAAATQRGDKTTALLLDYLQECFDEIEALSNHVDSLRQQITGRRELRQARDGTAGARRASTRRRGAGEMGKKTVTADRDVTLLRLPGGRMVALGPLRLETEELPNGRARVALGQAMSGPGHGVFVPVNSNEEE